MNLDFEKMAAEAAHAGTAEKLSGKEMGEIFTLTKGRVSQLTTQGIFVRQGSDYLLKPSVKNYLQLSKTAAASAPLMKAKLAKAEADARKAKCEADLAEGKTVSLPEVEATVAKIAVTVRSALLNFKNTLPERLQGVTASEISQVIDDEIFNVLKIIHNAKI
jgi:phage terminase Nu1 subunit (DNA packaging protein)